MAVVDILNNGSFRLKDKKLIFIGSSSGNIGITTYETGYLIVPSFPTRGFRLEESLLNILRRKVLKTPFQMLNTKQSTPVKFFEQS